MLKNACGLPTCAVSISSSSPLYPMMKANGASRQCTRFVGRMGTYADCHENGYLRELGFVKEERQREIERERERERERLGVSDWVDSREWPHSRTS